MPSAISYANTTFLVVLDLKKCMNLQSWINTQDICIDNYYDVPSISTNVFDDIILYLKKYYKENMEFLYDPKIPAYSEIADMLNEIKDFNFFKDVTKNDIHLNGGDFK